MLLSKELIFSAFLVLVNIPSMARNIHGKKQMQWHYSPPLSALEPERAEL